MDFDQLRDTTMAVEHRILKVVRLEDAITADEIFSMLMGRQCGAQTRVYSGERAVRGDGLLSAGA